MTELELIYCYLVLELRFGIHVMMMILDSHGSQAVQK